MRLTAVLLACALALPGIAAADKGGKGHGNKGDKSDKGTGRAAAAGARTLRSRSCSRRGSATRRASTSSSATAGATALRASRRSTTAACRPARRRSATRSASRCRAGIRYEPVPRDLELRIGPAPHGYTYAMLDGDLLKLTVGSLLVADAIQGLVD